MAKHISIKRALLCNLLSMLLCISMLVGSTFAWFTDTASTGVNSIVAGNLDVRLVGATDDNELTAALSFRDKDGNTDILWEPGATFRTEGFRIRSNGNLALKYTIALNGVVGDAKLLQVIRFSLVKADGTAIDLNTFEGHLGADETSSDVLYLQGTMDADAGNEYMNETLSGITVVVYATQDTVENDSNGNTYDEDSKNPIRVSTAEELTDAINAGYNVRLTSSITLTNKLIVPKDLTIYGDGYALISGAPLEVKGTANVTIKDVRFASPVNAKNNASHLYCTNLKGKLVIDGCSFTDTQWDSVQILPLAGSEIIINNCTFALNNPAPAGNKTRFVHIEAAQNSNADVKITLTNNFFGASTYLTDSMIDIDYINLAGIDFGGNNIYTDTKADIYVCGASVRRSISKADAYKALGTKLIAAATQES